MNVALLGGGHAAVDLHLPVLTGLAGVRVAAIAETNAERRAESGAHCPSARLYASYEELLSEADVEAVVIALPNPLHAPAAAAAFARGLHVYLEKPLATSPAEGQSLLPGWKASGCVGMIGYNYRFGSVQQEARSLITAGRIGRVVAVQTVFTTPTRALPPWKQRRATGGGALLDLASHHLDLVCWLLGASPKELDCTLRSRHSEDDTAVVQLRFDDGAVGQLLAAFGTGDNDRIDVYGTEGRLVIDRYRSDRVEVHPASSRGVRAFRLLHAVQAAASPGYWLHKARRRGPEPSYWRALGTFAEAVREGRTPSPSLLDGLHALHLVDAAERAAATGRTVTVDDVSYGEARS